MKLVDMVVTPPDSQWYGYRLDAMSFHFIKNTLESVEPLFLPLASPAVPGPTRLTEKVLRDIVGGI